MMAVAVEPLKRKEKKKKRFLKKERPVDKLANISISTLKTMTSLKLRMSLTGRFNPLPSPLGKPLAAEGSKGMRKRTHARLTRLGRSKQHQGVLTRYAPSAPP